MTRLTQIGTVAVCLGAGSALADDLLITDYGGAMVRRFDAATGAYIEDVLVDPGMVNVHGFTFDPAGNGYVTDETGNIWKFDPAGAPLGSLTGVIGSPALDRIEYRDGELWVSNYATSAIERWDPDSGDYLGDLVFDPEILTPNGFAFGPDDNFYIVSEGTNSVRRYDGVSFDFIDEFVAAGAGGLDQPVSLCWGPDDNLYVTSIGTNDVKRYNGATGAYIDDFVTSGAGGLSFPVSAQFGPGGSLFVGGVLNDALKEYDGSTGAFIGDYTEAVLSGMTHFMFIQGDACYADCDGSGELDFFDFLCFQNAFAGGDDYADCDGSGALDFFDFLCFQNEFAAGCP
ncbi:MAG: hypothetical protein ACF8R7_04135 [Phycisphaerales bacterium JB039]